MESILATILFVFIIVWAFRIEINTAKTRESLERIEKLLSDRLKKEKK